MTTIVTLEEKLNELVYHLQVAVDAKHALSGYTSPPDRVSMKIPNGKAVKFIRIDIGSSGCFLVEKATGELFNIKAYGVPDRNKKAKADIGNIFTADLSTLFAVRYNYLK